MQLKSAVPQPEWNGWRRQGQMRRRLTSRGRVPIALASHFCCRVLAQVGGIPPPNRCTISSSAGHPRWSPDGTRLALAAAIFTYATIVMGAVARVGFGL